jgi:hypothetical protein
MDYPEVKRAHIVPRCYLKQFAVNEQIEIHIIPTGADQPVSIDDAAVRKTFYRRFRPEGTPIDDVEWTLSQLESVAAPLLSTIEHDWPLPKTGTRAQLAEFFALQAVRGPRWRAWHSEQAKQAIEETRRDPVHKMESGLLIPLTQGMVDNFAKDLLSETRWLVQMSSSANKLVDLFGSMTWDLIKFDEPLLCLSDHPVVDWPLHAGRRVPGIASGHGWANILEVRVPLAPDLGLLMTWKDLPDASKALQGTPEEAANFNAFTIAQAEKQWMWQPDSRPIRSEGPFDPLSIQLCPGYERAYAEQSRVRAEVVKNVNQRLGKNPGEAKIVTINYSAA